jgi:hypothetical protein
MIPASWFVGVPTEHVAVEVHGLAVLARVELEPRGSTDLARDLEPLLRAGLPRAEHRPTRILQHGRLAVLADVHRAHLDRSAVLRHGLRDLLDVVGHQMDAPTVGIAGLAVVVHATADVLAVLREREVASELLLGLVRRPAEELGVERRSLAGVRAEQVDPARSTDDERWCGHERLPCRVRCSE